MPPFSRITSIATVCAALAATLASPAQACIFDGPPVMRTNFVISPMDRGKDALEIQELDLVSIALPSGSPDDWEVTMTDANVSGSVRNLSPQEWARVTGSPRAQTMHIAMSRNGREVDASRPQWHLGALRPGTVTVRLRHLAGKDSYLVKLRVIERRKDTDARPTPPDTTDRLVPTC